MSLSSLPPPFVPLLSLAFVPHTCISLGAFQRVASALRTGTTLPRSRRFSGGPALFLSPGTLVARLSLPSCTALVPDADPPRLVNRHVRPLLQALRRLGFSASYPGRDWVAVQHIPLAWIGFAHHAASGVCAVEFVLPYDEPFDLPSSLSAYPSPDTAPWLGKSPTSLRKLSATPPTSEQLLSTITDTYQKSYGSSIQIEQTSTPDFFLSELQDERPPWDVLREEVVGFIGASGPPHAGLGGDFFASEDLILSIDQRLSLLQRGATRPQLRSSLEAAAEETGGVLEGVRSLETLLDGLEEAFAIKFLHFNEIGIGSLSSSTSPREASRCV